jgi:tartrate dehydratase beta subunit/fumarate hydratase class I family protein|tara:strand:- start:737 stop:910 length:174 start_codon:yes stop_codon:yes gene_type:complete
MNKYNIKITGSKDYIAKSLDEARNMAYKDMEYIHYLWNVEVNSYTKLGRIDNTNEEE